MVGRIISNYRIIGKLGGGGMGVVYLAEHLTLKRKAAIKTIKVEPGKQDYRQRFLREARTLASLRHSNIAHVYDYGETPDGIPYLVMELVEGQTLKELLARERLTLASGLQIIGKVAEALAEAHQKNVIHRDIKPSNIIVNERGEVKVVDFGIAKSVKAESPAAGADANGLGSTVTSRDVIVGTPGYLSPEQAVASRVDARSDIFSLGALLYECIAGRPAFQGKDADDIRSKMLYDDPPPPSEFNRDVPPDLDRLTLKALAKKADDRFQTANEFLKALTRVHHPPADDSLDREKPPVGTEPNKPPAEANPEPSKNDSQLTNWRSSIVSAMRRPRHLAAAFLITLAAGFALWGISQLWPLGTTRPEPEAVRLYNEGVSALREGAYMRASQKLKSATELDKRFMVAYTRLAETLFELDDTDGAEEAVLQAGALTNSTYSSLSPLDPLYFHATNALALRDFGRAIEQYRQIVEQTTPESRNSALLDLGSTYEKSEDLTNAIKVYEAVAESDSQNATAFLRLGALHGRKRVADAEAEARAFTAFEQAEKLYKASGNGEGLTEVLYSRGSLLNSQIKLPEARDQLQQALVMSRTVTFNKYQEIRTLLKLSSLHQLENKIEAAIKDAREAIELAQSHGMESLHAEGLIELGNAFFTARDYAAAAQHFRRAVELAEKLKASRNLARARFSLGSLYIHQEENTEEGLRLVEQAYGFYRQGGYSSEVSRSQLLRGRAKLLVADYEGAAQDFSQLLQSAQEGRETALIADLYFNIGLARAGQDAYPEALRNFNESYNAYKLLGPGALNSLTYCLLHRGNMRWQLGQYVEARKDLNEAEAEIGKVGLKSLVLRRELIDAQMMLSQGHFPEARTKSRKILTDVGQGFRRTFIEASYTICLADVLSGANRGMKHCEDAVEGATGMRDPLLVSNALLALAQAKLETGAAREALTVAQQAQKSFGRVGRVEGEWRANFMAWRASQRMNDYEAARSYRLRINDLLSALKQKWGEENFASYTLRSDVKVLLRQLNQPADIAR